MHDATVKRIFQEFKNITITISIYTVTLAFCS